MGLCPPLPGRGLKASRWRFGGYPLSRLGPVVPAENRVSDRRATHWGQRRYDHATVAAHLHWNLLSRTQRTRTFAIGAGFSPFGGGPYRGIGSRHPWTQCNRITRCGHIFEATRPARTRLALVLTRHDHQTHVEAKNRQRGTPDPPWPQHTRTNGEGGRPVHRRSEPSRLTGGKPLHLPLTLKTHEQPPEHCCFVQVDAL